MALLFAPRVSSAAILPAPFETMSSGHALLPHALPPLQILTCRLFNARLLVSAARFCTGPAVCRELGVLKVGLTQRMHTTRYKYSRKMHGALFEVLCCNRTYIGKNTFGQRMG